MEKQVELVFNSHLTAIFQSKPEILRYLMNHERKGLVIKNCCQQIAMAEASNIRQRFDTSKYSTVIFECAKLFADAALTHSEQQAISRLEKLRRIDEANRLKNIEEEFNADQKEYELSKRQKVSYGGIE